MILLDTDVVVDIIRGFPPAVAWLAAEAGSTFAIPGYAAMEIIAGCRTKVDQDFVRRRLDSMSRLWLDAASSEVGFKLFMDYRLSHSLGLLDALIAQAALSHGLPLYTFNQKHFSVVPGLRTIQPYQR